MNTSKIYLFLLCLLISVLAFATKDRVSHPKSFQFEYLDGSTEKINSEQQKKLDSIQRDFDLGNLSLSSVIISYNTGENVQIKYVNTHINSITLKYWNRKIEVPKEYIKQLHGIDFNSTHISWFHKRRRAFRAKYFSLCINHKTQLKQYSPLTLFAKRKLFQKIRPWKWTRITLL